MFTQSPLVACADLAFENPSLQLTERQLVGHLNLRGTPDASFLHQVSGVIGLELPTDPNTCIESNGITALWLSPDEWLLITPDKLLVDVVNALNAALLGQHFAVTDISSAQTQIRVCGPLAAELLAKGTPIDLHPRVFAVGLCAQTVLAKAGVTLFKLEQASFEVIVRRSFADYLWRWLHDATLEFNLKLD